MAKTIQSYVLGVAITVDSKQGESLLKSIDSQVIKNTSSFQKYGKEIQQQSKRSADDLRREEQQIYKGAKAFKTLGSEIHDVERQANSAHSVLGRIGSSVSGIFSGALGVAGGNLITGALSGITSQLAAQVEEGFRWQDMWGDARELFITLGDDAQVAEGQLQHLYKTSIQGGYQMSELLVGYQRLRTSGYSPAEAEQQVKGFTNIAAAIGGGAAAVNTLADAWAAMRDNEETAGRSLRSFERMGIPVFKILSEATGRTPEQLRQLAKQDRLNTQVVQEILTREFSEGRYAGLAERMSNDFEGSLNKMSQIRSRILGLATEPLLNELGTRMQSLADSIGGETGENVARSFATKLQSIINFSSGIFDQTVSAVKGILGIQSPSKVFIDIGYNSALGFQIGFSQGMQKLRFTDDIEQAIEDATRETGVDPNLLRAVIQQESSGRRRAVSPKGASGPMGLMPATARRFGVTNVFDSRQNIMGGARYLQFLLKRYNGNLDLALAAYNAGEGAVDRYHGIPPYPETQRYVPQVKSRIVARGLESTIQPASESGPVTIAQMMLELTEEERRTVAQFEELKQETMRKLAWAYGLKPASTGQGLAEQYHRLAEQRVNDAVLRRYQTDLDVINRDEQSFIQSSYAVHRSARQAVPVVVVNSEEIALQPESVNDTASPSLIDANAEFQSVIETMGMVSLNLKPVVKAYGDEVRRIWNVEDVERFHRSIETALKIDVRGIIGEAASFLPQQQVGHKRGFFSKLLGLSAPFLNFIPGFGPILSTIASVGSNALGGNWSGAVNAALGGTWHTTGRSDKGNLPHRAFGGPVRAGRAYVVGDHPQGRYNPEVFIPREDGNVFPLWSGGYGMGGDDRMFKLLERMHEQSVRHEAVLVAFEERIRSMPADHVVMTGRRGLLRAMDRDPGMRDGMGRRLGFA